MKTQKQKQKQTYPKIQWIHSTKIVVVVAQSKKTRKQDWFKFFFFIQGDSGGPLIYNGIQVGLTSFGATAGCEIGYPSGFTRISHFRDWILTNTGVWIIQNSE